MANILSGTVTVATAGTRVAFPSARKKCVWIKVTAREGNTGVVYFGDVTVSSSNGYTLYQGTDGVNNTTGPIPLLDVGGVDLSSLYLDSASNGDKADFVAVFE